MQHPGAAKAYPPARNVEQFQFHCLILVHGHLIAGVITSVVGRYAAEAFFFAKSQIDTGHDGRGGAPADLIMGAVAVQQNSRQGPARRVRLRPLQIGKILGNESCRGGAVGKRGMTQHIQQEAAIIRQAQQGGIFQATQQAAPGFLPVAAMGDDLGHHGIIKGRNFLALDNAGIDPYLRRGPPGDHRAGLGQEIHVRILGIKPHFDGMTVEFDGILGQGQGFTRRHIQLPGNQVQAGDHFGHRMLHLQAGVHLQKVKTAIGGEQKFDGARAHIVDGLGRGHRRPAHCRAKRRVHRRRRRLFHHFLMPPLD